MRIFLLFSVTALYSDLIIIGIAMTTVIAIHDSNCIILHHAAHCSLLAFTYRYPGSSSRTC